MHLYNTCKSKLVFLAWNSCVLSYFEQANFAVKGYKKRLTSLFCHLSIAYVLVVYVLKSGGFLSILLFVEEWINCLLSVYYIINPINRQVYFAVKIHRMRWYFSLDIAINGGIWGNPSCEQRRRMVVRWIIIFKDVTVISCAMNCFLLNKIIIECNYLRNFHYLCEKISRNEYWHSSFIRFAH